MIPPHILIHGPFTEPPNQEKLDNPALTRELIDLLSDEPKERTLRNFLRDHPEFDLNTPTVSGETVLEFAIDQEYLELIETILNEDPSLLDKPSGYNQGRTYTYLATHSLDVLRIFVKQGADINLCDWAGRTPLQGALFNENLLSTKLLLLKGGCLYRAPSSTDLLNRAIQEIKEETDRMYEIFCSRIHFHPPACDRNTHMTRYFGPRIPSFFSNLPIDVGQMIMGHLPTPHAEFVDRLK